ncbi:DUF6169 family protein [Rufibacter sediminis]|uniref:Uncharacterized protein n=1 Tax=Rufibacter sediminis TaxID=2762756 RepID=A0ABR6VNJ0_9BACT|nr:DUF6169 family protein [Rufibacter sediminis]MBC3538745.1 hypothetical protein [Rufibacter sediminis]
MTSPSSNLNPYELLEVSSGFQFLTDQGKAYIVYTTEAEGYFPEGTLFAAHTLMFGFKPLRESQRSLEEITSPFQSSPQSRTNAFDPRISDTIVSFIQELFKDKRTVLLYVCDQADGRQGVRAKLFDSWFRQYRVKNIIKATIANSSTVYACMLFSSDNPYKAEIEDCLPEMIEKISDYLN